MIILYSAGVFNTQPVSISNTEKSFEEIRKGVDLSNLNEINNLETAIKNNPNDDKSLLQLAHLLNDSGFYDKAIVRYNEYLLKQPNEADVLVDLGVCYYNTKKNIEAIEVMEKALKVSPKHQIGHFNLGIVNLAAGNHDKAMEWFTKAMEIDPNSNIGKKAKELLQSH